MATPLIGSPTTPTALPATTFARRLLLIKSCARKGPWNKGSPAYMPCVSTHSHVSRSPPNLSAINRPLISLPHFRRAFLCGAALLLCVPLRLNGASIHRAVTPLCGCLAPDRAALCPSTFRLVVNGMFRGGPCRVGALSEKQGRLKTTDNSVATDTFPIPLMQQTLGRTAGCP